MTLAQFPKIPQIGVKCNRSSEFGFQKCFSRNFQFHRRDPTNHDLGISMDSQPRGFHYHSPNNTLGGQAAILTQVRQAPIHHSVIQNNNSYIQNIQFNPSPTAHG